MKIDAGVKAGQSSLAPCFFLRAAAFQLFQDQLVQWLFQAVFWLKGVFAADKHVNAALKDVRNFYKYSQRRVSAAAFDIGNMAGIYV